MDEDCSSDEYACAGGVYAAANGAPGRKSAAPTPFVSPCSDVASDDVISGGVRNIVLAGVFAPCEESAPAVCFLSLATPDERGRCDARDDAAISTDDDGLHVKSGSNFGSGEIEMGVGVAVRLRLCDISVACKHRKCPCLRQNIGAPSEDRTHDLEIMRLTRCLLRHRGSYNVMFTTTPKT